MGSSRCRGGEHAPNGLAAKASTGYAGHIFEELCGFPLPQLPDIASDSLRGSARSTFLEDRLAAQESLLHTPHRRLVPSGVQQIETPQQQLCCMRTAIFGGMQCLQICICIRAERLSRFVELSQLFGGFLTEPGIHLRHTVASRVVVQFQASVLSLSGPCCQRCDVAEQLPRSETQIRIKAARHFGVAWKLCRPLCSGRLFLR